MFVYFFFRVLVQVKASGFVNFSKKRHSIYIFRPFVLKKNKGFSLTLWVVPHMISAITKKKKIDYDPSRQHPFQCNASSTVCNSLPGTCKPTYISIGVYYTYINYNEIDILC